MGYKTEVVDGKKRKRDIRSVIVIGGMRKDLYDPVRIDSRKLE